MALYTGKGDGGTTKLFDSGKGKRVSKTAGVFEALGTLDELNANLGLVKVLSGDLRVGNADVIAVIHDVQDHIFTIQAEVAGAAKTIPEENVRAVEQMIADIEEELPEITSFFVPGGVELATRFDVARTVARRAERRLLVVHESGKRTLGTHTRVYINRLSSLLYALARLSNHRANIDETPPQYQ